MPGIAQYEVGMVGARPIKLKYHLKSSLLLFNEVLPATGLEIQEILILNLNILQCNKYRQV